MIVVLTSCNEVRHDNDLSIIFTGDVLLDRGVRPIAERNGVEYLFDGVESQFHDADYVVVNLECPLTDTITPINKKYIFRGDASWANGLRNVGITHAALANNHTMDQGRKGLITTARMLKNYGIETIGYGTTDSEQIKPIVVSKDSIRVAIFNSTNLAIENWVFQHECPGICQVDIAEMARAISKYKLQNPTDFVVLVIHWGYEFQPQPAMQQRIDATQILNSGADVIVGHHPHVIQPIDTVNGKVVFYSLGNFVFDQRRPDGRKAQMVKLKFNRKNYDFDVFDIEIRNNRPYIK